MASFVIVRIRIDPFPQTLGSELGYPSIPAGVTHNVPLDLYLPVPAARCIDTVHVFDENWSQSKTCMHTVANPSPFSWVLCVCLGVAAVASLPWLAIPSKLSATLLVSWFSVRSRVNTKYLAFMPCERLPSEDAYD
jgi:hypothetical protein